MNSKDIRGCVLILSEAKLASVIVAVFFIYFFIFFIF